MIRAEIQPYSLTLKRPIGLGGRILDRRAGWLLRVSDADGHVGWGEAAPLPGYSVETPDEAIADLISACAWLNEVRALGEEETGFQARTASVTFAVELALANLKASRQGVSLAAVLRAVSQIPGDGGMRAPASAPAFGLAPARVRAAQSINAVLLASEPEGRVRDILKAGFRTIKMKVGCASVSEDADRVGAIAAIVDGRADLRLDANRAWSRPQADEFASRLAGIDLAYIEEPLAEPRDLPEFSQRTGLRVAIDESLVDLWPDGPGDWSWVTAAVLKPTIIGGVRRAFEIAAAASSAGVQPVISSSVETSVGLFGLAAMAISLGEEDVAAGLDTARLLAEDVTMPPFPSGAPSVDVAGGCTYQVLQAG